MNRIALLAGLLLPFVFPASAWACKCADAPAGKCADLFKDNTVFLGTVDEVEKVAPSSTPPQNLAVDSQGTSAIPSDSVSPANPAPEYRYHLHVDDNFAGAGFGDIDVFSGGADGDCGYRFQKGRQYVVFTQKRDDGRFFATICGGTRPASEAQALLPQLRALRDGRRVAAVFGILRRVDPPLLAPDDISKDALPNTAIKLRSQYDRFSTSTGTDGVFAIYDVHGGDYEFSAELPGGMELRDDAQGPFTIPDGACYEHDAAVVPTGQIRGSVLGPDGKPLRLASVELYRFGQYQNLRSGLWRSQNAEGFFDFSNVGPGDYLLVFNRINRSGADYPFGRTFYPGVPDLSQAQPIKLEDGQQLTDVNIRVGVTNLGSDPGAAPANIRLTGAAGK